MKNSTIKRNYIYNTISQILSIIVPIMVTPYITRVIGAERLGIFSYTNSIVSYFALFSSLGINAYASRQIAFYQGIRKKQTQFFCEVASTKIIFTIPWIIMLCMIAFVYKQFTELFLIESLYLFESMVDIEWLYVGNENFKVTVARNIGVKVLSTICIFVFVRSADDLLRYMYIIVGSTALSKLLMWIGINKYIDDFDITIKNIKSHLKGGISLFAIQMTWSVYTYLDKVMIGLLQSNFSENSFYEQSQKIVVLSTTIISSLSTVMLPRISNAYINKEKDAIKVYMNKSIKYAVCLGSAMSLGLIACSSNIVPWFLGDEYSKCVYILYIISPIILLNSLFNVLEYQYLLGTKQEGFIIKSMALGAGINILMNLLLIPGFGAAGASLASVISQLIIVAVMFAHVCGQIHFDGLFKYFAKCTVSGIVMLLVLIFINGLIDSSIFATLLLVAVGALVYLLLLVAFKEGFISLLAINYLKRIKR